METTLSSLRSAKKRHIAHASNSRTRPSYAKRVQVIMKALRAFLAFAGKQRRKKPETNQKATKIEAAQKNTFRILMPC